MSRSSLLVIALTGLLVTAGCMGLLGDGSTPDPTSTGPTVPTASSTAFPSASTQPTEPPSTRAPVSPTPAAIPGSSEVKGGGIGSPEHVADAHHVRLRNTSFTVRYASHQIRNGRITSRMSGTIRYGGDGITYYNYTTVDVNHGRVDRKHVEAWSSRTTALRAITTENGTVIEQIAPTDTPPTFADQVELYVRSFGMRMTGYSQFSGEPVVHISADSLDFTDSRDSFTIEDHARWIGITELIGGRFSADLAGNVVRRYRVRLVGRGSTGSISTTREIRFTRVGETTVHRPAWVTRGNTTESG